MLSSFKEHVLSSDIALKLSDIVHDISCQQSFYNSMSLYKLIIIINFYLL